MYSESNFNSFENSLFKRGEKNAEESVASAKKYAQKRRQEGENDSDKFYKESKKELERELEAYEREKLLEIEIKYRRKKHLLEKRKRVKILRALKEELRENFHSFGECFVKHITLSYDKGVLTLDGDYGFEELKKFEVRKSDAQGIVFESGREHLEINIELIIKEYIEEIKKEMVTS